MKFDSISARMTGYGGMKNCIKDYGKEVPFMCGRRGTFAGCVIIV
jgi:hypothetical protein